MNTSANELLAFALIFMLTLFVFKKAKSVMLKIVLTSALILYLVFYIVPMLRG